MSRPAGCRPGALTHLIVLDLTQFLAGPYCTQILADLGARVIKVEPPQGDSSRKLPPHFIRGDSAYFHSVNRNKESVVLDLKRPEGQALFQRMVRQVDAVIENFRPGVMQRMGLDYPQLSQLNPRMVMCSITGFGRDGPYREQPAYDAIVQALSGGMSITGEPGRRPVRAGIPLGDLAAGMFGAIGTLAALIQRDVSGRGQHVDVSMLDCQVSMLCYQAVYHLVSGEVPGPQGRGHVSIPTYRSFTCADDRDVIITANTEKMWVSLCQVLEMPELLDDRRFRTNEDRLHQKEALWERLEAGFRTRSSEQWLERLRQSLIPAAPVNTIGRALSDPQVLHRNMVVTVQHPEGDEMRLLGNPVKMSGTPEERFGWPPKLGEHTRSVLQDLLGLTFAELRVLEKGGIIHAHT